MGFIGTSTLSGGIELASWKNAEEKGKLLRFSRYLSPFLGSDPEAEVLVICTSQPVFTIPLSFLREINQIKLFFFHLTLLLKWKAEHQAVLEAQSYTGATLPLFLSHLGMPFIS